MVVPISDKQAVTRPRCGYDLRGATASWHESCPRMTHRIKPRRLAVYAGSMGLVCYMMFMVSNGIFVYNDWPELPGTNHQ